MDNVNENDPQSIAEPKVDINQKIHSIPKRECVWMIDNLELKCVISAIAFIWNTPGKHASFEPEISNQCLFVFLIIIIISGSRTRNLSFF